MVIFLRSACVSRGALLDACTYGLIGQNAKKISKSYHIFAVERHFCIFTIP